MGPRRSAGLGGRGVDPATRAMTWVGVGRILVRAGLAAGFATAAVWSLRLGWADYQARKETLAGMEAALRCMPQQAEYHFRLSVLTADTDPARSIEALQRAVKANPSDARSWISLGLRCEEQGNLKDAERYLLRAAAEDRRYLPRWTLANYYFRRTDMVEFQVWAKAAAEMVLVDASGLFRLCGRVVEDGKLIDRLEIRRPMVRASYLSYLLNEGRLDVVMPAVRKVIEGGRDADVPLLMAVCDRLIERASAAEALEIWNRLADARRIPFGTLDPKSGRVLTDGRFAATSTSNSFAWRMPAVEGVSASAEDNGGGLRLTFSGSEPEDCQLLEQIVPLREDTGYELGFKYRASGIAAAAGLEWRVTELDRGAVLGQVRLSSEDEQWTGIRFRTPAQCRLGRLALRYSRKPGTTRIAGFLVLREIAVRPSSL